MSGPRRAADSATPLLKDALPDFIDVACYWASSESRDAVAARDALKEQL
jgi:hypothetical protein